jgi:putative FmdB family regulatory protein
MPLYEYRCEDCSRRFTLLVGVTAQAVDQQCPRCGGARLRKLISRFAVARSEDDLLDSMADPSTLGDPEDPRAMADWMRRMGREMGEDMGDDFDELVEEAVREEVEGGPSEGGPDGLDGGDAGGISSGADLGSE